MHEATARNCLAALLQRYRPRAAPGFDEVMIPGEPEARRAAERRANGVAITVAVWDKIAAATQSVGVEAAGILND